MNYIFLLTVHSPHSISFIPRSAWDDPSAKSFTIFCIKSIIIILHILLCDNYSPIIGHITWKNVNSLFHKSKKLRESLKQSKIQPNDDESASYP